MQTLTFTQKLLRQRRFLSTLVPLLALFLGLNTTQKVMAQTVVSSNVALNVRGTPSVFDTQATMPGTSNFTQQNFGTFNIGSDVFTLDNATFRVNESAGFAYDEAVLRVRVFQGMLATPSTAAAPAFINIALTSTGLVGGVRTFTLTTGGRNLLAPPAVTTAGSPGTSYRFDVAFRAIDNTNLDANGNPQILSVPIKNSVFTAASGVPQVSTATLRNVVVTSGTSAASVTTSTYDATATTAGPGVFNGTDFGALDANAGRLLLQGGTIQIVEKNGDIFNQAAVSFVVTPGTLATANAGFTDAQKLPLVQTAFDPTTGTRTFSLSNAARNILALAMTGGAGTTYRFDIAVSASGMDGAGNQINIAGLRQRSVFTVTGTPTFMPTLTGTTVLISPMNAPNVSYNANNVSPNPSFNGANLGTFDISTGQLVLNGGTATTNENGSNTISSVTLYYRVRQTGTGGGGFTPLALTQDNVTTSANGSRVRNFSLSSAAQNLLSAVTAIGIYNVDVYLQASGANSATATNTTFNITDDNAGQNYVANFTVDGTPVVTTVWTGGFNDNWFDTRNWTDGVPNLNKNAFIPNLASGSPAPYPNIYSDAIKPPTMVAGSSVPADPGYSNLVSGNAQTRNLTMQGNSQLDRSITRLIVGRLDVFGDFNNPQGSFSQEETSIISFKSAGAQTISGSPNGFFNVEIDGGISSIKTLTNSFRIKSGGSLRFINGILQTDISRSDASFVVFEGEIIAAGTVTPAAMLLDETETSFFRGIARTDQAAPVGVPQNFSNMGLTLTFTGNDPGLVTVIRNNAENYLPSALGGTPPKPSIRRVFIVRPASIPAGGLTTNVAFRYLTNETVNLRTNNATPPDFSGSVDPSRLSLYVSSTGEQFFQLGRDSNGGNILTKNGVSTFGILTLSELQAPLPVTLTTFEAKRLGVDALITWETASEINSKGFEVQVSVDGEKFRTLSAVPSAAPNTISKTAYRYVDTEKNKLGIRFYRLRQIDLDGKETFFTPRAVNFESKVSASNLVAYPNPFNGNDQLHLVLQSAAAGKGQLYITDMAGRVLRQETVEMTAGVADIFVNNLGDLKTGVYLIRVVLPTSETQNIKVVKQ